MLIDTLREQWNGLTKLDEQITVIERRLRQWMLEDKAVKAITEIPGVGVLTATAAVATMGDAKSFIFLLLMLDVLTNQLLVSPHCGHEIPSRPEMLPHEVLLALAIHPSQVNRALTLHVADHL
jgi:hypothetical protein